MRSIDRTSATGIFPRGKPGLISERPVGEALSVASHRLDLEKARSGVVGQLNGLVRALPWRYGGRLLRRWRRRASLQEKRARLRSAIPDVVDTQEAERHGSLGPSAGARAIGDDPFLTLVNRNSGRWPHYPSRDSSPITRPF
jgi:hypothetical protein